MPRTEPNSSFLRDATATDMVTGGMVGWRVKVKFSRQDKWFRGFTTFFSAPELYVLFDDGDKYTASLKDGDQIEFEKQLYVKNLYRMHDATKLPSFETGEYGAALVKLFRANVIDPELSLAAALKKCDVGCFDPDKDTASNGCDEDNSSSDSSPEAMSRELPGSTLVKATVIEVQTSAQNHIKNQQKQKILDSSDDTANDDVKSASDSTDEYVTSSDEVY